MAKTRSRRERAAESRQPLGRLCPQCGAEYVAGTERCSDCNVPLFNPVEAPQPLAPEAAVWAVFETDHAPQAQLVVACLHESGLAVEHRDVLTVAGRIHSILVEKSSAPEAARVVEALELAGRSQSIEAIVLAARDMPLPTLGPDTAEELVEWAGARIEAELAANPGLTAEHVLVASEERPLSDTSEFRLEADLAPDALTMAAEIPAEINRWIVLSHVIGGLCGLLALNIFVLATESGDFLWWSGLALAIAASFASFARGLFLRRRWEANSCTFKE